MNYDDGSGSGMRRLSEDERMRLLREEEQALGLWETCGDDTVYLPSLARLAESALPAPPNSQAKTANRNSMGGDGSVEDVVGVGAVSV